jgi:hypothetical protein
LNEATVKTFDTFDASERVYSGKLDHQHHGKGSPGYPIHRSLKQSPKPLSPSQSNPRHVPELSPNGSRVASGTLLQSKYSSPSNMTSTPTPSNIVALAINKLGQRIDLPLERPAAEDQVRYEARWRAKKLCNEYHLCGMCRNQDCRFDHNPIDEGIRLALRISARQIPCKHGQVCRRQDCPNGHHCPYSVSPGGCTNRACPFRVKGMHNVDDLQMDKAVQGQ